MITTLQVGSHGSIAEGGHHLPQPSVCVSFEAAWDMVGFLGCKYISAVFQACSSQLLLNFPCILIWSFFSFCRDSFCSWAMFLVFAQLYLYHLSDTVTCRCKMFTKLSLHNALFMTRYVHQIRSLGEIS